MNATAVEKTKTANAFNARSPAREREPSPSSNGLRPPGARQAAGNFAVQRLMRSDSVWAETMFGGEDGAAASSHMRANLAPHARLSTAPAGAVQKKCAACASGATCPNCVEEERRIQTKEKPAQGADSDRGGAAKIPSLRGGGQPLTSPGREFFESGFGADLSSVRVHTDEGAELSATKLGARAFTAGTDIAFAPGEYRPDSAEGRLLLAHELTHVVQQSSGGSQVRASGAGDDVYEREADETAHAVTEGETAAAPSAEAEERRPELAERGHVPAVQRDEKKDHADESYVEFVARVLSASITRLEHNISSLDQWSDYVRGMEDFQLDAQLMSGDIDEYAARAAQLPSGPEMFETFAGTHEPGERAFMESRLAVDASYRERVGGFTSYLTDKTQGYMTDPSVAERMQVRTNERSAEDLPPSTYVPPDPRYHNYIVPMRNLQTHTGSGCQFCHDVNFAWGRTAEEYGDPLPKDLNLSPLFSDPALFGTQTGTGGGQHGPAGQPTFDRRKVEMIGEWLRGTTPATASTDDASAATQATTPTATQATTPAATQTPATPDAQPAAQPEASIFVPEMALPQGVEAPVRHSDLCGDPPPSDATDYRSTAASWGTNSATVMRAVQRVGTALGPLGPRGYQVLPRQTFDQLWNAGPEQLAGVREAILSNIGERQDKYRELIQQISTGQVPYEELCPMVDELLPSTNESVRSLVLFEIAMHRAQEKFVSVLLAIAGLAMLLFAFIFPPAIMLSAPMIAAGAGLAVAGLAVGARDYRRGTQYGLGARAGVYSASQEAQAESLRFWGMVNMVMSAFALIGSVRAFNALPATRTAGALAESTPVGLLPGVRISELPDGSKMLWHPDFPDQLAFLDSQGLTLYNSAGGELEEIGNWPASSVAGAEGGAAPGGASAFSIQNALPAPRRPLGLLVQGETLPNPNQCFALPPDTFRTGGVSNLRGPLVPTPVNPSGLATNCGFCSISGSILRQSQGAILVNADELYGRTLENLGLPTETPEDPISRMLVFPDRQGFSNTAARRGYEALFTGEGNRLSEYTVTSVAQSHGLRVTPANNVLNEYPRVFNGSLQDVATTRWNAMREAAEEAGQDFTRTYTQVEASVARQREMLAGDYIIGSTSNQHFMNMTIEPSGQIIGQDFQNGATYAGLNAIKGRMGEIDFILRVEGMTEGQR